MLATSLGFGLAFFVAAFLSTLAGLGFRAYLADRLRLDHARDMIGGVMGLVITLVALVLGLLIWTAFGVFSTQKAELQVMAANALEFNQETREYEARRGPCAGVDAGGPGLGAPTIMGRRPDESGGYRGFNQQHG